MKKAISILLTIAILFTVSGCSGTKASDKAVSVAKKAVEVVDDYLDGKITYKSASEKIDDLYNEMAYVDDLAQDDENKVYDFSIGNL